MQDAKTPVTGFLQLRFDGGREGILEKDFDRPGSLDSRLVPPVSK
jgi:hypothetical protein